MRHVVTSELPRDRRRELAPREVWRSPMSWTRGRVQAHVLSFVLT
jgi:hypothetical protein